jgi:hypothetical protein
MYAGRPRYRPRGQVLEPGNVADDAHPGTEANPDQEQNRLVYACSRRLENGRHGHATRKGQPLEVDHLLAQRNDESNAEKAARDAADDHQQRIEVGPVQNEQGGNREHHPRRGGIDGAGDSLADVVLDDAGAAQQTPQDTEAQNGRQFRAFMGETQDQGGITQADRDDDPDAVTKQYGGPGELRVRPPANDSPPASLRFRHVRFSFMRASTLIPLLRPPPEDEVNFDNVDSSRRSENRFPGRM